MCLHCASVSSSVSSANSRSFALVSKNFLLRSFVPVSRDFLLQSVPVSTLESVRLDMGSCSPSVSRCACEHCPGPSSTPPRLLESLMSRGEKLLDMLRGTSEIDLGCATTRFIDLGFATGELSPEVPSCPFLDIALCTRFFSVRWKEMAARKHGEIQKSSTDGEDDSTHCRVKDPARITLPGPCVSNHAHGPSWLVLRGAWQ